MDFPLPSAAVRRGFSMRKRLGADVDLRGVTYRVFSEEASGERAGKDGVPKEKLSVFIGATDPRLFNFSPLHFKPYTEVDPPREGEMLTWHELTYEATHVTAHDVGNDTDSVLVYALRKVF